MHHAYHVLDAPAEIKTPNFFWLHPLLVMSSLLWAMNTLTFV